MHKIHEKEFTLEDFSTEHLISGRPIELLEEVIKDLNYWRYNYYLHGSQEYKDACDPSIVDPKYMQKQDWWQMIQLLPSSYNQTRNVMMNYEVLFNIYKSRKDHKLDEWREFCKWIESLPYSELICGNPDRPLSPLLDPKYKED